MDKNLDSLTKLKRILEEEEVQEEEVFPNFKDQLDLGLMNKHLEKLGEVQERFTKTCNSCNYNNNHILFWGNKICNC